MSILNLINELKVLFLLRHFLLNLSSFIKLNTRKMVFIVSYITNRQMLELKAPYLMFS